MILCLGSAADETFLHTLTALRRRNAHVVAIDVGQLTMSGEVEIDLVDPLASSLTISGRRHPIGSFQSVWIRLLDLSPTAPTGLLGHRAAGVYLGLSRLFSGAPLPVINPPAGDLSNFSKVFHSVSLGRLAGWQVPRTCLTNDPDQALEFISSCAMGAVFKGASGTKTWASLYDAARDGPRLPLLRNAPVLFQERIKGPDVRVHIVQDRCFAESIESADLDYRTARGNRYEPLRLPIAVAEGCATLCAAMRAPFLGVDFKVESSSGQWFFLEANSLPSYQGYDRRLGGAISQALADWLLRSRDATW